MSKSTKDSSSSDRKRASTSGPSGESEKRTKREEDSGGSRASGVDVSASHSYAYGSGWKGGAHNAECVFTVQLRDAKKNKLREGGVHVNVQILHDNDKELPLLLVDNQNGTYSVTYTPISYGYHYIHVSIVDANGRKTPISDSLARIEIPFPVDGPINANKNKKEDTVGQINQKQIREKDANVPYKKYQEKETYRRAELQKQPLRKEPLPQLYEFPTLINDIECNAKDHGHMLICLTLYGVHSDASYNPPEILGSKIRKSVMRQASTVTTAELLADTRKATIKVKALCHKYNFAVRHMTVNVKTGGESTRDTIEMQRETTNVQDQDTNTQNMQIHAMKVYFVLDLSALILSNIQDFFRACVNRKILLKTQVLISQDTLEELERHQKRFTALKDMSDTAVRIARDNFYLQTFKSSIKGHFRDTLGLADHIGASGGIPVVVTNDAQLKQQVFAYGISPVATKALIEIHQRFGALSPLCIEAILKADFKPDEKCQEHGAIPLSFYPMATIVRGLRQFMTSYAENPADGTSNSILTQTLCIALECCKLQGTGNFHKLENHFTLPEDVLIKKIGAVCDKIGMLLPTDAYFDIAAFERTTETEAQALKIIYHYYGTEWRDLSKTNRIICIYTALAVVAKKDLTKSAEGVTEITKLLQATKCAVPTDLKESLKDLYTKYQSFVEKHTPVHTKKPL